jgi:hypothetical protein
MCGNDQDAVPARHARFSRQPLRVARGRFNLLEQLSCAANLLPRSAHANQAARSEAGITNSVARPFLDALTTGDRTKIEPLTVPDMAAWLGQYIRPVSSYSIVDETPWTQRSSFSTREIVVDLVCSNQTGTQEPERNTVSMTSVEGNGVNSWKAVGLTVPASEPARCHICGKERIPRQRGGG